MSSQDDADPATGHDDVGSLAEEAEKFFGALTDWAKDAGTGATDGLGAVADQAAAAAHSVNEHLATGSAECQWCPVCRVVHAVRETSPEVRQHLALAASSLLQAVSGMLATATPAQDRGEVERIDLDPDAEDWPDEEDLEGALDDERNDERNDERDDPADHPDRTGAGGGDTARSTRRSAQRRTRRRPGSPEEDAEDD